MGDELYQVLNSDHKEMSAIATMLLELQKDYRDNRIEKEEYVEILKDIEQAQLIEKGAGYIKLQALLLKGISSLIKIA
jgi:hypothetical protein